MIAARFPVGPLLVRRFCDRRLLQWPGRSGILPSPGAGESKAVTSTRLPAFGRCPRAAAQSCFASGPARTPVRAFATMLLTPGANHIRDVLVTCIARASPKRLSRPLHSSTYATIRSISHDDRHRFQADH
jgi:hypothetical protein